MIFVVIVFLCLLPHYPHSLIKDVTLFDHPSAFVMADDFYDADDDDDEQ